MIIITEGLTGKNAASKVKYGGNLKKAITGNAYFTGSTAALAGLNTATIALKDANDSKITGDITLAVTDFDNAVRFLVLFAQGKILGVADELAIVMVVSGGMTYKKQGKPIIADLSAKVGILKLSVDLRKKVTTKRKHVAYIWQRCEGEPIEENYEYCLFSTVASVTVTDGMKKQTLYNYRVATVIGTKMSKFSDPVAFTTS